MEKLKDLVIIVDTTFRDRSGFGIKAGDILKFSRIDVDYPHFGGYYVRTSGSLFNNGKREIYMMRDQLKPCDLIEQLEE